MTGESRLLQICGYLRCRLTKNSPRRTPSTPAGVFCTLLASVSSIFKSAGGKGHLLPRLFSKGLRQKLFRTATDVGGSTQQQVFREKNLSLNSVHECALFNRVFSKALAGGYSFRCRTQINPQYISIATWQVQKLTSLSIFEREFLLCKNIAAA